MALNPVVHRALFDEVLVFENSRRTVDMFLGAIPLLQPADYALFLAQRENKLANCDCLRRREPWSLAVQPRSFWNRQMALVSVAVIFAATSFATVTEA